MRFTPAERAALVARVDDSPFASLAHWCRLAVNDAAGSGDLRPGMPVFSEEDVRELSRLCAALNERAAASNRAGAVLSGSMLAVSRVGAFAAALAAEHEPVGPAEPRGRRRELVNLRATVEEHDLWRVASLSAGFPRASAWCRDVLLGASGRTAGRAVTASVLEARRQLAGAVVNAAQLASLASLAGEQGGALAEDLDRAGAALALALQAAHRLGATR